MLMNTNDGCINGFFNVVDSTKLRQHAVNKRKQQRVLVVLFTKILFRHLKRSGETILHREASNLVNTMLLQRKQNGSPLVFVHIEESLRAMVGEAIWNRALIYTRIYVSQNPQVLTPWMAKMQRGALKRQVSSQAA